MANSASGLDWSASQYTLPAHRLMREVAAEAPWAQKLAEAVAPRAALGDAAWYFRLLRGRCRRVDEPLGEADRAEYWRRYADAIAAAYPAEADGTVLLPFPQLFIVATR